MLIEEFKRCVHLDIKTHLDERKVESLNEAAVMADDYSLTHKGSFLKTSSQSRYNSNNTGIFGQSRNSPSSDLSTDKKRYLTKISLTQKRVKGQVQGLLQVLFVIIVRK